MVKDHPDSEREEKIDNTYYITFYFLLFFFSLFLDFMHSY